jgi:arylformamidase
MIATIFHRGKEYRVDLFKPIDISIPVSAGGGVRAWYVNPPVMEPVRTGDWTGSVKEGGSVNFRNILFNPHGHGTHTECVGHITPELQSVNQSFDRYMFIAEVITLLPQQQADGDYVITRRQLENILSVADKPEAVVIRTLSNGANKLSANYSDTNPPYILEDAMQFLNEAGVLHLLIDMPSVDRERDGGKLLAHHAFWKHPFDTQLKKTITELIYVPNEVFDGTYLLEMQVAAFENDAAPSRPVLYKVF